MSLVHVLAVITAKPGKRAEVLANFNENVPAVHAEDGCIEYGAVVDCIEASSFAAAYGQDTFVVVEKWESLDHLKAHAAAPHMKAYAEKNKDLLADRKVHVMTSA
ncbi:MAG: antibiotic biosynthesis monooxygenase [Rhodospirillaceae bacterium]|nr:antibiotic biosynthesis monooxygenase [Rhodospirillaceae bacterium]|tara:strand:+ start:233 stop:547 length:315 start_codon:yes stop_codon:yes gene_type:complete